MGGVLLDLDLTKPLLGIVFLYLAGASVVVCAIGMAIAGAVKHFRTSKAMKRALESDGAPSSSGPEKRE